MYFSACRVIYAGHEVVVGFTDLSGVTTASPGSTVYITVGVLEGKLEKNETVKLLLISGPGSVIGKNVLSHINECRFNVSLLVCRIAGIFRAF